MNRITETYMVGDVVKLAVPRTYGIVASTLTLAEAFAKSRTIDTLAYGEYNFGDPYVKFMEGLLDSKGGLKGIFNWGGALVNGSVYRLSDAFWDAQIQKVELQAELEWIGFLKNGNRELDPNLDVSKADQFFKRLIEEGTRALLEHFHAA